MEMNILKTLQQFEVAPEKSFGKKTFLKCQEIFKYYKSKTNSLKMLTGGHFC